MTNTGRKWVSVGVIAVLIAGQWSFGAMPDARRIMQEQKDRHSVTSEVEVDVMLLVDRRGNKQQRELKRYFKQIDGGLHRALLVFTEPADIRGTALLVWEQTDRDNDQWLYLPAQKRMQRIGAGSKKSFFMGTDFTYADMEPEQLDDNSYNVLEEQELEGHACFVIEAVAADDEKARQSPYGRRVLWVRKEIYFTVKIEFYDRNNRLLKTQTNHELENIEGNVWRAKKALMDNHQKGHQTLIGVKSREVNGEVEDSVFTERFLVSGQHLR